MTSLKEPLPTHAELLDALIEAESELIAVGSRLEMPGTIRIRLLEAAHRAQRLIEVAETTGQPEA